MNSKKFMQIALDQAHIARNKNEGWDIWGNELDNDIDIKWK